MGSFSFLHAADLHLDSPFKGLRQSTPRLREELIRASFRAWDRLVQEAVERRVDFVLLSGDLTDHAGRSVRAHVRLSQGFRRLQEHGIAVYAVRGNHDPEDGEWSGVEWPDNVHFFPSREVTRHTALTRAGRLPVHVYGISYPERTVTDNLAKLFPKPEAGVYNIAVLHANVDGREGHEPYSPCSKEELIGKGYDYWALGHIHVPQVLHERPYVVYSGNLLGRHMKEQGERGCYYIEVDDAGESKLEFISLADIQFIRIDVDISDVEEPVELHDRLLAALDERIDASGSASFIYRIRFIGSGKLHSYLQDAEQIGEWLSDLSESYTSIHSDRSGSVWMESWEDATLPDIDLSVLEQDNPFIQQLLQLEARFDDSLTEVWMEELLQPVMSNRKTARYVPAQHAEDQRKLLEQAKLLAVRLLTEREEM
ncbi:metallophosphoesterase family protein [Marinicrinis lubricantis]|uniref:Exonuclease SbcCD subunit D n=1 Tax=Marinicrinis lubricantis TaxID=2086470 RepID=A0ABW1IT84_9BACL